MSEPTRALEYLVSKLRQWADSEKPLSPTVIGLILEHAAKLQYPLRKVDAVLEPVPEAYGASVVNYSQLQVKDGVLTGTVSSEYLQPKGCTSATPARAPEFKVGDQVIWVSDLPCKPSDSKGIVTGWHTLGSKLLYDVLWTFTDGYKALNIPYLPKNLRLVIKPQDERDDWFTQRIDPYDDRIRYLERFVHGLKSAGVGGK